MADIDILLDQSNPKLLAKKIAESFKNTRIRQNLTQELLSERSGVSLSSLKRFEQKAEIALMSLLKLAIALDSTSGFEELFNETIPNTLNDFLETKKTTKRKRARKNGSRN